jgi:Na+/H+ antiporter NhaA
MSLFIAIMSFENNLDMLRQAQLGVFIGSVSSALAGAIVLKLARNK